MLKKFSIILFTTLFILISTDVFAGNQKTSSPKPSKVSTPKNTPTKSNFGSNVKPKSNQTNTSASPKSTTFGTSTKPKQQTIVNPTTNSNSSSVLPTTKPNSIVNSPSSITSTRGEQKPTSNLSTIRNQIYKSKDGNTLTKPQIVESLKKKPDLDKKFPTKFTSEPTLRPTYIPQTYRTTSGQNVNITYNNGSYGYIDPISNVFMGLAIADMLNDDNTVQIISNQEGYSTVTTSNSNGNGFKVFFSIAVIALFFILFIGALTMHKQS